MPYINVESEDHWHTLRGQHVGGSEVASLFYWWELPDGNVQAFHMFETPPEGSRCVGCLSSFKTGYGLWHEKVGNAMPDTLDDVERVQGGLHLEPAIATWANDRWDWQIRKVRRYFTHPEVPGWGASLDYEVVEQGTPPVELKNVDALVYKRDWLEEQGEIILPPLPYMLQLQCQIGAKGADRGWFVACVGGNKLRRGQFPRHEPSQAKIADAILAFWKAVQAGHDPVHMADYGTASDVYAVGGEAENPVQLPESIDPVIAEYLATKAELERVETDLDFLKGKVVALLGHNTAGVSARHKLTWPAIKTPARTVVFKENAYRGGLYVKVRDLEAEAAAAQKAEEKAARAAAKAEAVAAREAAKAEKAAAKAAKAAAKGGAA